MEKFRVALLIISWGVLQSCHVPSDSERLQRLEQMRAVSGEDDLTVFKAGTPDQEIDLKQITAVAATIRESKRLHFSEAETLRQLAQQKFDGFVLQEERQLQAKFEKMALKIRETSKHALRKAKQRAQAKIRRQQEDKAAHRAVLLELAQQEAEIRALEKSAIQALVSKRRELALSRVRKRFRDGVAIRVKTRDNKPVVALASINEDRIERPDRTFELNTNPTQSQGNVISHGKKKFKFIETKE